MEDVLIRFWNDLVGRLTGPMTFRLILQPSMAMLYALRDGVKDAQQDKPPYFWALFMHPDDRRELLNETWKAIGRVILLGVVMDAIYQLIVIRWIYPNELVVVVLMLAVFPYVVLRGPVNRIARRWTDDGKIHVRRF